MASPTPSPDSLTNDQVKHWLVQEKDGDRDWLAAKCGVTKPTVNGWLSAGRLIPHAKLKIIHGLMHPDQESAGQLRLPLTHQQWMRIEAARKLVGEPPHDEFYRDAIIDYSERIIASESSDPSKIKAHPSLTEMGEKGRHRRDQSA